jgi:H+/gluconate symporter-like permease
MLKTRVRFGGCLLILSIILSVPIFLHVGVVLLTISRKVSFGLLRLQKWAIGGELGMVDKSDFGRMFG